MLRCLHVSFPTGSNIACSRSISFGYDHITCCVQLVELALNERQKHCISFHASPGANHFKIFTQTSRRIFHPAQSFGHTVTSSVVRSIMALRHFLYSTIFFSRLRISSRNSPIASGTSLYAKFHVPNFLTVSEMT